MRAALPPHMLAVLVDVTDWKEAHTQQLALTMLRTWQCLHDQVKYWPLALPFKCNLKEEQDRWHHMAMQPVAFAVNVLAFIIGRSHCQMHTAHRKLIDVA